MKLHYDSTHGTDACITVKKLALNTHCKVAAVVEDSPVREGDSPTLPKQCCPSI
jgi:hypothetical protein